MNTIDSLIEVLENWMYDQETGRISKEGWRDGLGLAQIYILTLNHASIATALLTSVYDWHAKNSDNNRFAPH